MVILSFALPVCRITIHKTIVIVDAAGEVAANAVDPALETGTLLTDAGQAAGWDWWPIVGIIYRPE